MFNWSDEELVEQEHIKKFKSKRGVAVAPGDKARCNPKKQEESPVAIKRSPSTDREHKDIDSDDSLHENDDNEADDSYEIYVANNNESTFRPSLLVKQQQQT